MSLGPWELIILLAVCLVVLGFLVIALVVKFLIRNS